MLRVLLVEDSPDDELLLRFQLDDAALAYELRRVASERDLRRALGEFSPTVAVSDLSLPGYCGLAALALVHAHLPELPLWLVTGDDDPPLPDVPAHVLPKSQLARLPGLLASIAA